MLAPVAPNPKSARCPSRSGRTRGARPAQARAPPSDRRSSRCVSHELVHAAVDGAEEPYIADAWINEVKCPVGLPTRVNPDHRRKNRIKPDIRRALLDGNQNGAMGVRPPIELSAPLLRCLDRRMQSPFVRLDTLGNAVLGVRVVATRRVAL